MKSLLNLFKHKENKEKLSISLAPKVITEESEKEKIKPYLDVSRPKNGLQLFCQFNLCFSFFKLSIVCKNSFTTSV